MDDISFSSSLSLSLPVAEVDDAKMEEGLGGGCWQRLQRRLLLLAVELVTAAATSGRCGKKERFVNALQMRWLPIDNRSRARFGREHRVIVGLIHECDVARRPDIDGMRQEFPRRVLGQIHRVARDQ